LSAE
jgi:hypothetical protein